MHVELSLIKGLMFDSVEASEDMITFRSSDGRTFKMFHEQDCCEVVTVEDITGDLSDLVGAPILLAEERSEEDPNACESGSWTFYEFATIKGYVTIRWYGSSNGYYGESVSLVEKR